MFLLNSYSSCNHLLTGIPFSERLGNSKLSYSSRLKLIVTVISTSTGLPLRSVGLNFH